MQAHYGRREIVRALRTSDPTEAKRAHLDMLRTLEAEFDAARRQVQAEAGSAQAEAHTPFQRVATIEAAIGNIAAKAIDSFRDG